MWQVDPGDARLARVEAEGLVRGSTAAELTDEQGRVAWERVLTVHVEGPAGEPLDPPMLGDYVQKEGTLSFIPAFPLREGSSYLAVVSASINSALRLTVRHEVPAPDLKPSTVVVQVFPSADVLPENLLKFYVHFSAPMSRGHVYDHIELIDETGKRIVLPFLELDEELWNPELTRLTLLIDPGRIKRGVQPLEEVGPSLQVGQTFTLRIGKDWKDARGVPLASDFAKTFRVTLPDRASPDPVRWTVAAPQARSRDPLVVTFREPLDHALALRLLHVRDAAGDEVAGTADLTRHETEWRFVPDEPWEKGSMELSVGTILEDLAGNSVGKPFEVDMFDRVERRMAKETVSVPFEIR